MRRNVPLENHATPKFKYSVFKYSVFEVIISFFEANIRDSPIVHPSNIMLQLRQI